MSRLSSITLFIIGLLLLMSNLGWLGFVHVGGPLRVWWPLIMVIIGLIGLLGKS